MKLSPLIIGTMRLGAWGAQMNEKSLHGFIESCLALGQSSFDHADIYGHYTTEEDFGVVLKGNSALRDRLQLITKCGIGLITENRPENKIKHYNSTKEHIINSVENSLKALNTDRIDLLLIRKSSGVRGFQFFFFSVSNAEHEDKIIYQSDRSASPSP